MRLFLFKKTGWLKVSAFGNDCFPVTSLFCPWPADKLGKTGPTQTASTQTRTDNRNRWTEMTQKWTNLELYRTYDPVQTQPSSETWTDSKPNRNDRTWTDQIVSDAKINGPQTDQSPRLSIFILWQENVMCNGRGWMSSPFGQLSLFCGANVIWAIDFPLCKCNLTFVLDPLRPNY